MTVLLLLSGCSWFSDGNSASTTIDSSTTTTWDGIGVEFSFDTALALGVDLGVVPPLVTVPRCMGGVTRVALVSNDLRSTMWEIMAVDASNPPRLEMVNLGDAPEGFQTVVPLAEGTGSTGIVVVNSADEVGLAALDKVESSTEPDSCE